ncbi:MAG: hypothetical protein QM713_13360 [Arachnia sp.]
MSTLFTRTTRLTAAGLAAALGLTTLGAIPAFADNGTWLVGGTSGATISVADAVIAGDTIHLEGTGWLDGTDDSDADGSWIAVKLGAGGGVEPATLTTEPAAGQFTFPGATTGTPLTWSGIVADDDGDFSVDVPFPTSSNTSPALAEEWAPGTTHHLQLLTGSVKPTGDTPRSVYVTFTVAADTLNVTAASGGRGVPAGQVTITVTAADGTFAPSEALTAKVDGADAAWATGGTATEAGGLASARGATSTLVFPAGTLRAGTHTVEITGPTSGTKSRTVTVLPTASFSALTQASEGELTLSNLPAGSSVSAVSLEGSTVAFSGLPAAEVDGAATIAYTIPADAPLGSFPVTVTLSNPSESFTLANQKISPDTKVFGEKGFTVLRTRAQLFQGLYQSAYSAKEEALFVASASGTGANEDGHLYKLNPNTLEILATVHTKDVKDAADEQGQAPYGIGVDDTHGTVWVTNTRTGGIAVYRAADLALLKQFPKSTIGHPRDVIHDPVSDRIFVSSASEGTSGDGLIMAVEADDENGNGVPFEKIADIQTGPRTDYSPMSLAVQNGVLVSPSLSSNKVIKVNTKTLDFSFLEITGINVGGRGASGIAYDAAGNRLYIASQNSDELVIADATTGATIKEVATGAGALNAAFDPVNKLVYVANFGGTTVTVLAADGTKVANLPIARANHISVDGLGNAYVVDKNAEGNKAWKISVVPKPKAVSGSTPTISGTAKVGKKLTAKAGTWTSGAKLSYQWKRDGKSIKGATSSTYTLTASDLKKKITVTVTGSKSGYTTVAKTSKATAKVAAGTLTAATPKISGTAKVGKKLTAKAGTWTKGTKLTYAWYANGKVVKGKTSSTLKLTSSVKGKKITVKVTGTKSGYNKVTKTSKATAKVKK